VRRASLWTEGWGEALRAAAGDAARGTSLPRVPGLDIGDVEYVVVSDLLLSPNMLRVCAVTFLVASFIALEVTAGGGTPSRDTGVCD
jgi:hypothetical protein